MKVAGKDFRTIWLKPDDVRVVQIIDQRTLPHRFVIEDVTTVEQMATAIREMHVRGAGLIGAAAGYGMHLGALAATKSKDFDCRDGRTTEGDSTHSGESRLGNRASTHAHGRGQRHRRKGRARSGDCGTNRH